INVLHERILEWRLGKEAGAEADEGLDEIEESCRRIVEMLEGLEEGPRPWVQKRRRELVRELQEEVSGLRRLDESILICPICERMRNSEGHWVPVSGIAAGTPIFHRVCPYCLTEHYPEVYLG
ncbi:MAG: hypothetical protein ACE5IM_05815, partial [Nitrospinota bacterium]